ncbi:GNAT family N-acetyltransferase [Pontibacter harenae]|uniref:GNAT family N-acetyltransferase n=1 Tax=Pontibacter harenae TaxID=2894083 RepID=UPI001E2AA27F|nr:GNAT family N-acetyltransferase [Pontibacter harenae]MCC9168945.1 GNAT family N-acetyltransferase [Pontibacter harenae]
MIRFLNHVQINKSYWDACIEASLEKQVYALSWYLDVVAPGWCAVVEEQQGKYTAIFPLPIEKKWGYNTLGQPLFCQQLGLFFSDEASAKRVATFMSVALKQVRLSSNYSFNIANTLLLEQSGEQLHPHHTHCLKLDKPYEQLLKSYTRYRRMNLKKAETSGLVLVESTDLKPLLALFRKHVAHKIEGGVSEEAYEQLQQLYARLQEHGMAFLIYAAAPDGKLVAGGLFLRYGNYITYLFNAADAEGTTKNGRTLILNEVIRQYAETNYVLDFETPPVEQIAFFYSSFGSEPTPFYQWRFNNLPLPIKKLRNLRISLIRKVRGKR